MTAKIHLLYSTVIILIIDFTKGYAIPGLIPAPIHTTPLALNSGLKPLHHPPKLRTPIIPPVSPKTALLAAKLKALPLAAALKTSSLLPRHGAVKPRSTNDEIKTTKRIHTPTTMKDENFNDNLKFVDSSSISPYDTMDTNNTQVAEHKTLVEDIGRNIGKGHYLSKAANPEFKTGSIAHKTDKDLEYSKENMNLNLQPDQSENREKETENSEDQLPYQIWSKTVEINNDDKPSIKSSPLSSIMDNFRKTMRGKPTIRNYNLGQNAAQGLNSVLDEFHNSLPKSSLMQNIKTSNSSSDLSKQLIFLNDNNQNDISNYLQTDNSDNEPSALNHIEASEEYQNEGFLNPEEDVTKASTTAATNDEYLTANEQISDSYVPLYGSEYPTWNSINKFYKRSNTAESSDNVALENNASFNSSRNYRQSLGSDIAGGIVSSALHVAKEILNKELGYSRNAYGEYGPYGGPYNAPYGGPYGVPIDPYRRPLDPYSRPIPPYVPPIYPRPIGPYDPVDPNIIDPPYRPYPSYPQPAGAYGEFVGPYGEVYTEPIRGPPPFYKRDTPAQERLNSATSFAGNVADAAMTPIKLESGGQIWNAATDMAGSLGKSAMNSFKGSILASTNKSIHLSQSPTIFLSINSLFFSALVLNPFGSILNSANSMTEKAANIMITPLNIANRQLVGSAEVFGTLSNQAYDAAGKLVNLAVNPETYENGQLSQSSNPSSDYLLTSSSALQDIQGLHSPFGKRYTNIVPLGTLNKK